MRQRPPRHQRIKTTFRITFYLPASPESRIFLGELRPLLAEVAYAESADAPDGAGDRLTLTPPQPSDVR